MVAPVKPRKVQMNGRQSFWLVPAVAAIAVPKITEINAVTGINLSCSLLKSFAGLQAAFSKVTLDQYLCEVDSYEANDTTTWTMPDIVGGFDPQAALASDDKKAFEFLRNGFTGFAVFRNGIVADQATPDAVVGQFFNVAPVSITKAVDTSDPSTASNIATFSAGVSVTGTPAMNVAAVAGP